MPENDCLICSMRDTEPGARVFLDELWAAEVAPGYEVPGWFFLRSRRHAEALAGLDDDEAATLGLRARDLTRAVEKVTGAPAVYLLHFGESYRHFHALILWITRNHGHSIGFRFYLNIHAIQVGFALFRGFHRAYFDFIAVPTLYLHRAIHVRQVERATRLQGVGLVKIAANRQAGQGTQAGQKAA